VSSSPVRLEITPEMSALRLESGDPAYRGESALPWAIVGTDPACWTEGLFSAAMTPPCELMSHQRISGCRQVARMTSVCHRTGPERLFKDLRKFRAQIGIIWTRNLRTCCDNMPEHWWEFMRFEYDAVSKGLDAAFERTKERFDINRERIDEVQNPLIGVLESWPGEDTAHTMIPRTTVLPVTVI
jgi:hypothetical protein